MYPWLPWLPGLSRLPFGGDVTQAIAPWTNWFSPTFEVNFAGDRQIESDIVMNTASYGKQLGILTEAVLALAGSSKSEAVERLRGLNAQIEERKKRHNDDLETAARRALEALKKRDSAAFERLLRSLAG